MPALSVVAIVVPVAHQHTLSTAFAAETGAWKGLTDNSDFAAGRLGEERGGAGVLKLVPPQRSQQAVAEADERVNGEATRSMCDSIRKHREGPPESGPTCTRERRPQAQGGALALDVTWCWRLRSVGVSTIASFSPVGRARLQFQIHHF